MKKIFLLIALSLITCLSFSQTRNLKLVKPPVEYPTNQKRKAVVIGMSDYGESRSLNNTLNDASDMADVLTKLGFEVTLLKNNDLRNLKTNLTNWYNSIEGNDMAIFYFAGHGMEVNGENYLIPVGAELNSKTDVEDYTLKVNNVLGNMDEKRVGFKLLILDACRDNPFSRGWSRGSGEKGLAQMAAPKGTLIAFAAAPGATAQDGGTYNLQNGVFTYYLKQEILKEGASIDNVLNSVAGDVSKLTHDQQLPYKTGILTEDFFFIPRGNDRPAPSPNPAPSPVLSTYYYFVDQNGNESQEHFNSREIAANTMKSKNLYGKIYSNMGEVFVVDKPVESQKPVADKEQGVIINGVKWATRNVGATPHTFADKPEDYGGYYQWNKGTTVWTADWKGDNKKIWQKANDPCPAGWRVPTTDELQMLECSKGDGPWKILNEDNIWTTRNGVKGWIFGNGSNTVFFPAAGYMDTNNGPLNLDGIYGYYWSSTSTKNGGYNFVFSSSGVNSQDNYDWSYGLCIRCVAE